MLGGWRGQSQPIEHPGLLQEVSEAGSTLGRGHGIAPCYCCSSDPLGAQPSPPKFTPLYCSSSSSLLWELPLWSPLLLLPSCPPLTDLLFLGAKGSQCRSPCPSLQPPSSFGLCPVVPASAPGSMRAPKKSY